MCRGCARKSRARPLQRDFAAKSSSLEVGWGAAGSSRGQRSHTRMMCCRIPMLVEELVDDGKQESFDTVQVLLVRRVP